MKPLDPHVIESSIETSQSPIAPLGGEESANSNVPRKKAIVVYEGDERWQPPSGPAFAENESDEEQPDQEDEVSTVSGSDDPEGHADLLADYASDSEAWSQSTWPIAETGLIMHLHLQNIQLLHAKVSSVPALRLPRFAKTLKTLCLRQNAIAELDPAEFSPLTELEDLDIYDNQVKDLGTALEGMLNLKYELEAPECGAR